MDRMFCYLWYEKTDENECKFGERWVKDGQDPETEIRKRIKDSVGVRKDKINDGTIELVSFWNVTELAKKECPERLKPHGKIDDYIRERIGFRKGSTGEIHTLNANEMAYKVNELLKKVGQPLPTAGLSQNQYDAACNVIEAIREGKRTIVAELCPRFGKTIWSGVLIRETNTQLTVVASYVLTSFTSFKKDLTSFEQFRDLKLIEAGEDDWKNEVESTIAKGQQCVVFLSMCQGARRQDKIDFLFNINTKRLVFIDEADFGVHQTNQSKPLSESRTENDTVILMTGTNGDKASSVWPVDHYISVTYPELLMEKKSALQTQSVSDRTTLTYFKVDPKRHDLVVDVKFYQMNLASLLVEVRQKEPEAFLEDGIFLPSWSKFATFPVRAKGFFTNMLQSIFEAKGNDESLNFDYQTKEGVSVAMMFLPGSTTNANMSEIARIAKSALQGWDVLPVYGIETTNADAESMVKERIESAKKKNQSVLILSAGMAQRSFSIPEITALFLAYDTGDYGATIQKMSRALTPATKEKIGHIISLSFDPNRDDKFDAMMVETAQNFKRNRNIHDLKQALREVIKTIDIFKCQPDGAVKMQLDEYLEEMLHRRSIDRIIGKIAPVTELTPIELRALATGKIDVFRAARIQAAEMGKTSRKSVKKNGKGNNVDISKSDLKKAREMIVTISQNIDVIKLQIPSGTIEECFEMMDREPESQNAVCEEFGVSYDLIRELILTRFINRDLLDLKFA